MISEPYQKGKMLLASYPICHQINTMQSRFSSQKLYRKSPKESKDTILLQLLMPSGPFSNDLYIGREVKDKYLLHSLW